MFRKLAKDQKYKTCNCWLVQPDEVVLCHLFPKIVKSSVETREQKDEKKKTFPKKLKDRMEIYDPAVLTGL